MRKRVIAIVIASIMAISMLALSACGGRSGGGAGEALGMRAAIAQLQERFPPTSPQGTGVGGVLNYALVSGSFFAGIHNPAFSITADDGLINDFMFGGFLAGTPGNTYSQNGAATFVIDRDNMTFTMHMKDDVRMTWWDGVPVDMYDLEFAYLMIAHPNVTSPRYGSALNTSTLTGVQAYRDGGAKPYYSMDDAGKELLGGVRVFNNGRSIELSYTTMSASIIFGGVWTQPLPRHHFAGIPYGEILEHPNSRSNVLGNGAFMMQSVVPGESVSLIANPNYHLGAPKLAGINIQVVHPDMVGEAMLIGDFDVASFPAMHLGDYEGPLTGDGGNVTLLSRLQRRFDFMGFRFGTLNREADTADGLAFIQNYDTPVRCLALRRALGYARDDAAIGWNVHNGLRFPISTTMIPWQGEFMREDMIGFSLFDLDKANQILDEAGYVWREGEMYRRNPAGERFHLVWAIAGVGTEGAEITANWHLQNWGRIGIDVRLYQGGLMEFNNRIETLEFDRDHEVGQIIHMYDAAWNFGSNPNPRGLWGVTSHNDTRYQTPELDAIFDRIGDPVLSWDTPWLIEQYYEYQQYIYDNAPWIPALTAVELFAVNNRVLNFSLVRIDDDNPNTIREFAWHLWDLSQATPFVAR
jgi:peptide/nickel transport system substrate-binding protein